MRAYRLDAYGTAPRLTEIAPPDPGPGEARIAVAACGLNFADLLMIEGRYQDRPAPPVTLGMELAGTVTALGPGTPGPAPGSRVAVHARGGGLAEVAAVPAARCLVLPEAMPWEVAAGFQVAYGTSHLALLRRARLGAGERLVVTGAAGGVGLTAVEIGALAGAEVVAVARGPEKLARAGAAGARHLIDADTPDLRGALTALGGVDVVYDTVGGETFAACFRATRPEGRLLVVGFAGGTVPEIKANHLLVKNLEVIGLNWGAYPAFAPDAVTEALGELLSWYAAGRIAPHVGHVLPLDRAAEALDLLRQRRATGKVVVTMGPDGAARPAERPAGTGG